MSSHPACLADVANLTHVSVKVRLNVVAVVRVRRNMSDGEFRHRAAQNAFVHGHLLLRQAMAQFREGKRQEFQKGASPGE